MPFMIVYGYTRIRGLSESLPGVPAIVRRQADESTTARSPRMLREQVRRVKRFEKQKLRVEAATQARSATGDKNHVAQ